MRRRSLGLSLLLAACAGASPAPRVDASTDAPRDVAADGPSDAPAAGDVDDPPCARPPAERPEGSVCVRVVRGRVVDLDDLPRVDIPVTVCGATCWVGRTDAAGRFAVTVGDFIPLARYSALAHARPEHATVYVPLPTTVGAGDEVVIEAPIRVPRYAVVGDRVPSDGGVARAGEVALTVAPGAAVELDLEDFKLGALGERLRVAAVPVDRAPPFAREGGLVAVWALAPFNLQASRPMGLRLPNTAGLAPGAAVDLVAMGWDILPPRSNAGRAERVSGATVTADGTAIESDPDGGVPVLTWIGVRARR